MYTYKYKYKQKFQYKYTYAYIERDRMQKHVEKRVRAACRESVQRLDSPPPRFRNNVFRLVVMPQHAAILCLLAVSSLPATMSERERERERARGFGEVLHYTM